ncbi:MAG: hypothetical protein ACTSP9_01850 [Promethearchaeota archaeon]
MIRDRKIEVGLASSLKKSTPLRNQHLIITTCYYEVICGKIILDLEGDGDVKNKESLNPRG